MAGKHRSMRRRSTEIAVRGAAATTAAALAAVMAAPEPPVSADVALAAATGPYTQGITSASGSFDNALLFMGNAGGAGAAFWNPIAGMSGGWLPTFTAQTTQNDLTTSEGLLNAAAAATGLNVVPGISGDATITILAATAETVSPIPGTGDEVEAAADTVLLPLASLTKVIDALHALNDVPLVGSRLAGIPSIEDLLDVVGLTATQTTFESTFSWPIFAADGKTTIGNTFIQLPSLTASTLVERIRNGLTVGGLPVPDAPPEVQKLVDDTLAPLDNIVSTPSATAWIPAGSGSYHALGGSLGFLAAAPIVAIGPVGALSIVPLPAIPGVPLNPASETVVALPIAAYGADLPFGIAGFGILAMPMVVSPAAVLVSPPLAVTYTRLNTGSAPDVGPNGVNYNSGTTVGLLATSVGIVPVMYSLGAVNAGASGLGVAGPSVFGIGVLPPVQVPAAQPLQALEGLDPAALVNPGPALPAGVVPTQLTDAVTGLALPTGGDAVTAVANPALSTVAPSSPQITKALNGNFGPSASELARRMVALNELLAQASQAIPPASTPNGSGLPVSTPPAASIPNNLFTPSAPVVPSEPIVAVSDVVDNPGIEDPQPRKRPRLNVTRTGNRGETAAVGSRTSTNSGGTDAPGGLRSTVQNAPKRVTDAVSDTAKSVTDKVSDAVGGLGKLGRGDDDDG